MKLMMLCLMCVMEIRSIRSNVMQIRCHKRFDRCLLELRKRLRHCRLSCVKWWENRTVKPMLIHRMEHEDGSRTIELRLGRFCRMVLCFEIDGSMSAHVVSHWYANSW